MLYGSGNLNLYSVTTYKGRMGWEVGEQFKRVGQIFYKLIHVDVQQKPIQCKAIILQLIDKKKFSGQVSRIQNPWLEKQSSTDRSPGNWESRERQE